MDRRSWLVAELGFRRPFRPQLAFIFTSVQVGSWSLLVLTLEIEGLKKRDGNFLFSTKVMHNI